jgi:hypothetical protein
MVSATQRSTLMEMSAIELQKFWQGLDTLTGKISELFHECPISSHFAKNVSIIPGTETLETETSKGYTHFNR